MLEVVVDYETRSRYSLDKVNNYKYADPERTEVLCMSWATPFAENVWRPGQPFPFLSMWPDVRFLAFQAEMELTGWNGICASKYGWPELSPENIECLQARCAYAGLPRNLAGVSKALGLGHVGKDMEGHAVTKKLCKPDGAKLVEHVYEGGEFLSDPDLHKRNEEYCLRDSVAERLVARLVPPLPDKMRWLWLTHQRINQRGIPIDRNFCRNAHKICQLEKERLKRALRDVTGVETMKSPDCHQQLKDWCRGQGYKPPLKEGKESLQAPLIEWELKTNEDMPKVVREALEIRLQYKSKAIEKYPAMLRHADADNRCRGGINFYGAATGRFQSRGINWFNFARLDEDELDDNLRLADEIAAADDVAAIHARMKEPIPTLGSIVRLGVRARSGHKLVVCDYSSIEMRVLHWMARDARQLKIIRDFDAGRGDDPYRLAAATIYGKPVSQITKAERQLGKVFLLSSGYLTGAAKFQAACFNYGIIIDLDKAQELVQLYRRSYPLVKRMWYELGDAMVRAVKDRVETYCGPVTFFMRGHTLVNRLPSGREIQYYDASVVQGDYGDEVECLDAKNDKRRIVGLPTAVENCIAGGTLVLTDKGWKPIESVMLSDKVWDGLEWCQHAGVVCSGEQTVIDVCGVHLTPDHRIFANGEWEKAEAVKAGRSLKETDLLGVAINDRQVPPSLTSSVEKLRRSWDQSVRTLEEIRELPNRHGAILCAGVELGSEGQRRELLPFKLSLGDGQRTKSEQKNQRFCEHALGSRHIARGGRPVGYRQNNTSLSLQQRLARPSSSSSAKLTKQVYDIRSCGPRHRFVVQGTKGRCLIVHNCDQGIAFDLLADALIQCDRQGLPVITHVYDEIVLEVPEDDDRSAPTLQAIMETPPAWAKGLPVATSIGAHKRYVK